MPVWWTGASLRGRPGTGRTAWPALPRGSGPVSHDRQARFPFATSSEHDDILQPERLADQSRPDGGCSRSVRHPAEARPHVDQQLKVNLPRVESYSPMHSESPTGQLFLRDVVDLNTMEPVTVAEASLSTRQEPRNRSLTSSRYRHLRLGRADIERGNRGCRCERS